METYEIRIWDDLSPPRTVEATKRLTVGLDGEWRVLDLTDENYQLLQKQITEWMSHGRPPAKPPSARTVPGAPPGSRRAAAIDYNTRLRAFAAQRGSPASRHGSVKKAVREEFEASNGPPPVWKRQS